MGGGMLRTAAKAVASAGPLTSPIVDQMAVAAAGRRAASAAPVSAGAGVASVPALATSSSGNVQVEATLPKRMSSVDDWELAGGLEEEMFDATSPTPRLVFGPVPTVEEAKEAASDLKDAIEKIYFSSPTTVSGDTTYVRKDTLYGTGSEGLLPVMHSTIGCSAIHPSAPRHVFQAFSLLRESPEVQNVVSSLASDKNVWDAVMKNEKVMEFYKSQQTVVLPQESSVGTTELNDPTNELKSLSKERSQTMGFMTSIKNKVSEMVSNLSDLIANFLSSSIEPGDTMEGMESKSNNGNTVAIGASFMALAIAAILVVLFKRA